jgi:signal transduction histidine kinase
VNPAPDLPAVWLAGASLAALAAGARVRAARRREALNRALHELRRPLQALALGSPRAARGGGPDSLDMAIAALAELDREVNGAPRERGYRPVACRSVVEAAVERWRGSALAARRALELRFRAGSASVMADPARLAQAIDNLIANALEHGGPRVLVDASVEDGRARIAVVDAGAAARPGRRRDPRRGHGLRVASEVASEHRGRLVTRRAQSGSGALLELPLIDSRRGRLRVVAPGREPAG